MLSACFIKPFIHHLIVRLNPLDSWAVAQRDMTAQSRCFTVRYNEASVWTIQYNRKITSCLQLFFCNESVKTDLSPHEPLGLASREMPNVHGFRDKAYSQHLRSTGV